MSLKKPLARTTETRNGRCNYWVHICCQFDSTFIYSTALDQYVRAGHRFPRIVHLFMNISLVFLFRMKGAQREDEDNDEDEDNEVLKNM